MDKPELITITYDGKPNEEIDQALIGALTLLGYGEPDSGYFFGDPGERDLEFSLIE